MNFLRKRKRLLLALSMLGLVVFLSACGTDPVSAESTGIWEGVIIYNFARAIIWVSNLFGENYGIGIIIVTVIIRALLIPFTHFQQKNMAQMNEISPQMEELKQKYPSKDAETQEKFKEEQQRLYSDAGVNPYMGCLPMLVQMPVFIALYQSVNRTPILATGNFLWVNLGQPDPYFILPILAGLFTLGHSVLMSMGRATETNKIMTYVMPLMIVFITFRLSSALALYFTVSNGFSVVQTLLFQNPFKIRKERANKEAEQAEAERQRRKALRRAQKYRRNVKK
ncbi:YidC/Oxa1 family membrane protein insertase [Alkalibacterium olivapovliticus]|uniref:Membrane protein insertase YidC n=1 Tax=Alkalibacterium olivapovliticus TaxID=99907 RepID=A0A2T0W5T6_9LACT|nr:YidC/Oxa1 family membrane protein insertase [Alkalibacterium olivapovliticus]